jgi:hypothetical protein
LLKTATLSEEVSSKKIKEPACETCGHKPSIAFFDGQVSAHFKGCDIYIGDLDFKLADDTNVIIAEIKYVSKSHKFLGKKISFNQAREYAAMTGVIDNLGREQKTYVFEAHEVEKPYVAIVPFLKPTGKERHAFDFLDIDNARLVYVFKEDQFGRWLAGDRYVGTDMRQQLKCV